MVTMVTGLGLTSSLAQEGEEGWSACQDEDRKAIYQCTKPCNATSINHPNDTFARMQHPRWWREGKGIGAELGAPGVFCGGAMTVP